MNEAKSRCKSRVTRRLCGGTLWIPEKPGLPVEATTKYACLVMSLEASARQHWLGLHGEGGHSLAVPALRRLRQEGLLFQASLGHRVRLPQQGKRKTGGKEGWVKRRKEKKKE